MAFETCLKHHFLLAMPGLAGDYFANTITYVCEHNADGALGFLVNRPLSITVGDLLGQLGITTTALLTEPVLEGGPVKTERGFVLHTTGGGWDATMVVSESISLTTSRDVIEAIAVGKGPDQYLIALGYAGWGEGQLEQEILANAWLNTPYSKHVLFDTPIDMRWRAAAGQIGIDINLLTTPAGHG